MDRPWFEDPTSAVAFLVVLHALVGADDFEETTSVDILPVNPDASSADQQRAIDVSGDFTNYEPRRFYGRTLLDAIIAAGKAQAEWRDK